MSDAAESSKKRAVEIFAGPQGNSPEKKHYEFRFALPAPSAPTSQEQPMDVDTSGPIRLPKEEIPHTSEKKQKLNDGKVKRKIRNLVAKGDDGKREQSSFVWSTVFRIRTLIIGSIVLLSAVLVAVLSKEDLRRDFYKRYKRQYYLLLYGAEDYCTQEWDFANTTDALLELTVGQQAAIEHMTEYFRTNREQLYIPLALLGPTGVGKSLSANIIATYFQWRENVHHFPWQAGMMPEKLYANFQSRLHAIRHGTAVDKYCGRHLLLIDNLDATDVALVNKINKRLRFVTAKDGIRLMTLYVFRGLTLKDYRALGALDALDEDVEKVFLQQLTSKDLLDCIRLEAKQLGVNLADYATLVEEVVASVDVARHGCKPVRAKVTVHLQL